MGGFSAGTGTQVRMEGKLKGEMKTLLKGRLPALKTVHQCVDGTLKVLVCP